MPLPSIIDTAEKFLFSDRDRMEAAGLPVTTIGHVIRLRDIYNYWISFPNKRDRDIVAALKERHGIGDSQARTDLKIVKVLLGNLEKTTKDYHRHRFLKMIERAFEIAEIKKDPDAMVKAADKYGKYTQLDKDDDRADVIDQIIPLKLSFTDNPEVIGIKRVPNARERIQAIKDRYWTEETVDVDFEELDAPVHEIFGSVIKDGDTGQRGISE